MNSQYGIPLRNTTVQRFVNITLTMIKDSYEIIYQFNKQPLLLLFIVQYNDYALFQTIYLLQRTKMQPQQHLLLFLLASNFFPVRYTTCPTPASFRLFFEISLATSVNSSFTPSPSLAEVSLNHNPSLSANSFASTGSTASRSSKSDLFAVSTIKVSCGTFSLTSSSHIFAPSNVSASVISQTTRATAASWQQFAAKLRYFSCPAVSHMLNLTVVFSSGTSTVFAMNMAPSVEGFSALNWLNVKRWRMLVLPTPEFPKSTIFTDSIFVVIGIYSIQHMHVCKNIYHKFKSKMNERIRSAKLTFARPSVHPSFSMQNDQAEMESEAMEYEPSPEKEGFLEQLSEKIRIQAQELQDLENYKTLCERRIAELCPEHPLPVQPSHLGKTFGTFSFRQPIGADAKKTLNMKEQELHYANQRNEKLQLENEKLKHMLMGKSDVGFKGPQDLLVKLSELQREKQVIEEALRTEMLEGEEQRNYIQILKQALESKIENFGFSEVLNEVRSGKQPADAVDIFVELMNIKKEADQHRKEKSRYESHAMELEAKLSDLDKAVAELDQENQEIKAENERYQEDLKNGLKALEESRETINRLEEEKNALLDTLEDLNAKNEQLTNSLESSETLKEKLSQEKLDYEKRVEQLGVELKRLENVEAELQASRDECDKCKEELEIVKNKAETKEKEVDEILQKIEKLEHDAKEKEELSKDKTVLGSQLAELEKVYKKLVNDHKNLQENYGALEQTLNETQNELDELKTYKDKLETDYQELEQHYNYVSDKLKTHEESAEENKKELSLTRKLKDAEVQEREETIMKLQEDTKNLRNILNTQKEAIENERGAKNKEIDLLQEEYRKLKNEDMEVKTQLLKAKEELVLRGDEVGRLRRESEVAKEEAKYYKERVEQSAKNSEHFAELEKRVEEFRAENEKLKRYTKEQENTIDELNIKLLASKSRLDENITTIDTLETESKKRLDELKTALQENTNLKLSLDQATREVDGLRDDITETERRLRDQLVKNEDLTNQVTQMNFEIEALQTQHQGVLTHIDLFKQKNEDDSELLRRQQNLIESTKTALDTCIGTIANFAQHFEHTSTSIIRTNVSRRFRDLMLLYQNIEPTEGFMEDSANKIAECLKAAFDEIESNIKSVVIGKNELNTVRQQLEMEQRKMENLEEDIEILREKERFLRNEVEAAREQQKKLERERELWYQREDLIEAEKKELSLENKKLLKEQEKYRAQIRMLSGSQEKLSLEMRSRAMTADKDTAMMHAIEEKVQQLTIEKRDLEGLIARIMKALSTVNMKRVVSEMLRVQAELWMQMREKARLETALLRTETSLRETFSTGDELLGKMDKSMRMRRDLGKVRDEILLAEENIEKKKKKLALLEDELRSLELDEQHKTAAMSESKKCIAQQSQEVAELERENSILKGRVEELEEAYKRISQEKAWIGKEIMGTKSKPLREEYYDKPSVLVKERYTPGIVMQNQHITQNACIQKQAMTHQSTRSIIQQQRPTLQGVLYRTDSTKHGPLSLTQEVASKFNNHITIIIAINQFFDLAQYIIPTKQKVIIKQSKMTAKTEVKFWVQPFLAEPIEIVVSELDSIGELKNILEKNLGIKKEEQLLIHFGETLSDNSKTILQSGILEGDTIFLTKRNVIVFTLLQEKQQAGATHPLQKKEPVQAKSPEVKRESILLYLNICLLQCLWKRQKYHKSVPCLRLMELCMMKVCFGFQVKELDFETKLAKLLEWGFGKEKTEIALSAAEMDEAKAIDFLMSVLFQFDTQDDSMKWPIKIQKRVLKFIVFQKKQRIFIDQQSVQTQLRVARIIYKRWN
eukprot:TRINITY_DN1247_c0_g1_i1.p1 TRINITY_DN1247_c0_g1~~TRINITY_DN1247_c0_g1_i1.p1  ORF type:complete len:1815 (+),score=205.72 TRINITY_DN1247_c0_g1_i1:2854-8298(+)